MNKFNDYHLYLGCAAQAEGKIGRLAEIDLCFKDNSMRLFTLRYSDGADDWDVFNDDINYGRLKLILRPLSDMTLQEGMEIMFQVFHDNARYPENDYKIQRNEFGHAVIRIDNDWYTESLVIGTKTGAIWSNLDRKSSHVKVPVSVYNYLRSRHFDLDGLTASGAAIDATTLPNNPYKD
jgi:hypothetical protein